MNSLIFLNTNFFSIYNIENTILEKTKTKIYPSNCYFNHLKNSWVWKYRKKFLKVKKIEKFISILKYQQIHLKQRHE